MKQLVKLTILTFSLCCCGLAAAKDRMVDGFPDLPRDAREVAERYMACQHFAGEYGGADTDRDREVLVQLRELKCDRIERDMEKVKHMYRRNSAVLRILKEAELTAPA